MKPGPLILVVLLGTALISYSLRMLTGIVLGNALGIVLSGSFGNMLSQVLGELQRRLIGSKLGISLDGVPVIAIV